MARQTCPGDFSLEQWYRDREQWYQAWYEARCRSNLRLSAYIEYPLRKGQVVLVNAVADGSYLRKISPESCPKKQKTNQRFFTRLTGEMLATKERALTLNAALDGIYPLEIPDPAERFALLVQIWLVFCDFDLSQDQTCTAGSHLFECEWLPYDQSRPINGLSIRQTWNLGLILSTIECLGRDYVSKNPASPRNSLPAIRRGLLFLEETHGFNVLSKRLPVSSYTKNDYVTLDRGEPPPPIDPVRPGFLPRPAVREDFFETMEVVERDKNATNSDFSHSQDFRSVSLRKQPFSLTPQQAQVVEILYEAHQNRTPELGQAYILEMIGTPAKRLRDTFKNSSAWGELIVPGKTQGTYRLNF